MQKKLLDGKQVAQINNLNLKLSINKLIENGNRAPKIAIIQVGNNKSSDVYIRNKLRTCDLIGIDSDHIHLDETANEKELIQKIKNINNDKKIDGMIVQLPLPKNFNEEKIIECIDPDKDADGFHPITIGKMFLNQSKICPATPKGIMKILEHYKINLEGQNVVIIGRSNIVGKPLSVLMTNCSATVTLCHSKTKDLKNIANKADILVCAIGKPKMITKDYVKKEAIVIDVGINKIDNKICGDVDFEDVIDKVKLITPVPGGVGPMTISSLLENVFELYKKGQIKNNLNK